LKKTIQEQMEIIWTRMFRRRLDQRNPPNTRGWHEVDSPRGKAAWDNVVMNLLMAGHVVSSGYYPTSVRNFHNRIILWKERKTPKGSTGNAPTVPPITKDT
jgi:hypothetical protein